MKVNEIIREAIKNAIPYSQYRALVEGHVLNNSNTGAEVTEALANYTALNHQRMKRLDKKVELLPETQDFLESLSPNFSFLVITESWCGDAAHVIPVLNKIAEAGLIDLKLVLRDENEALMNEFLTNGSKSIAKLIIYNSETFEPIASWGPRPSTATQMVADEKAAKGTLSPEFKQELQKWYNKDKGKTIEKDMIALIKSIQ